jgi:uncharacterized protein (DUF362 family)
MKRRDFLKTAALAGVASTFSLKPFGAWAVEIEEGTPDLTAIMGGSPQAMLKKAMETFGGMEKFVHKGQTIVVKPNIGWDKTPELAANTNPDLVGAIVKMCYEAGAKEVQVFDHTCNEWQNCYKNSGIRAAVEAAGGKMLPANDEKYYKNVDLPTGTRLKHTKIHEAILQCDAWINVPVLKNHGGAKLTCAMKNLMGIVWNRQFFHSHDLQQCIADSCTYSRMPALNIVDAYRAMKSNGPQGRSENDVVTLKSLLVSPDIVAVDAAALALFNQIPSVKLDESEVGHIAIAHNLNLGNKNLDKIKIKRIKM